MSWRPRFHATLSACKLPASYAWNLRSYGAHMVIDTSLMGRMMPKVEGAPFDAAVPAWHSTGADAAAPLVHELLVHNQGGVEGHTGLRQQQEALVVRVLQCCTQQPPRDLRRAAVIPQRGLVAGTANAFTSCQGRLPPMLTEEQS